MKKDKIWGSEWCEGMTRTILHVSKQVIISKRYTDLEINGLTVWGVHRNWIERIGPPKDLLMSA